PRAAVGRGISRLRGNGLAGPPSSRAWDRSRGRPGVGLGGLLPLRSGTLGDHVSVGRGETGVEGAGVEAGGSGALAAGATGCGFSTGSVRGGLAAGAGSGAVAGSEAFPASGSRRRGRPDKFRTGVGTVGM